MTRPLPPSALLKLNPEHAKQESQRQRAQRESAREEDTKKKRAEQQALKAKDNDALYGIEDVPSNLRTDGHRILSEENGRGRHTQTRVLTLAEHLFQRKMPMASQPRGSLPKGLITLEQCSAAKELCRRLDRLRPRSEGVSSYEGLIPGADPTTKGDRRARALTGFEIDWHTGEVKRGKRPNRNYLMEAARLLWVMGGGVRNEQGRRVFPRELTELVIRSVTETEHAVTTAMIGKALTAYTGSAQLPAAGVAALRICYQRGALYLDLVKGDEWDDSLGWIPM